MANTLKAGFARVNITPMLGIAITGYFEPRYADHIRDELEANAIAVECGDTKAVFISIDNVKLPLPEKCDELRHHIADVTGLPYEGVFICATHTHTGPLWGQVTSWATKEDYALSAEYDRFMYRRITDAAVLAIADLKEAHLGYGLSHVPGISFIRRYYMKDGTIRTNPGRNNPDVVGPVGKPDERVNVPRFLRNDADDIVLINFGTHPDVIGGTGISADWPGFVRRTFEKAVPGVKCAFFNGAQGDVNHINLNPKLLPESMQPVSVKPGKIGGYEHARFMGQAVAGAALQVFGDLQYVDIDSVRFAQKTVQVPSNMPKPEDIPEAKRILKLHEEGRDDEIPYTGIGKGARIAEARRMISFEHGPEFIPMYISVIAFGKIALVGIPGEPFTRIGTGIKLAQGWDCILPCCQANESMGYLPMFDSFAEGGYEARSSRFKAGVGELIVKEATEILNSLIL